MNINFVRQNYTYEENNISLGNMNDYEGYWLEGYCVSLLDDSAIYYNVLILQKYSLLFEHLCSQFLH